MTELLDPSDWTLVKINSHYAITNIPVSALRYPENVVTPISVWFVPGIAAGGCQLIVDPVRLRETSDLKRQMARLGISDADSSANHVDGKFVFLKNGTIILANAEIPHDDMWRIAEACVDHVGVWSAGFYKCHQGIIKLYGESVGLRRSPLCEFHDFADHRAIAEHLGLPPTPI